MCTLDMTKFNGYVDRPLQPWEMYGPRLGPIPVGPTAEEMAELERAVEKALASIRKTKPTFDADTGKIVYVPNKPKVKSRFKLLLPR